MKNIWKVGILFALILAGCALQKAPKNNTPEPVPPLPEAQEKPSLEQKGKIADFLKVPEGFEARIFAQNIPGARVMEFDPKGRMLVSQTSVGKISLLEDADGDGVAKVSTLISGLDKPHGLAFQCTDGQCFLYVVEHGALSRYVYDADKGSVSGRKKLLTISSSIADRHFTRTLLFLPSTNDHILLIAVGSSCNVCVEKPSMRGKIIAYDTLSGKVEDYATGLRNSVFMTLNPVSGRVFATEMGRDLLGDDLPSDEINIIEKGKNYGWPNCYGQNIHDSAFDKNTYIRNPCMVPFEIPSFIDIPAHSAPLGLSFVPEEGWPEEWRYNLLVSYHGSWNRSVATGYKIVRMKIDAHGTYSGTEDFITGFIGLNGKKFGRPVDLKALPGGTLYISDDFSGVIYKISRSSI